MPELRSNFPKKIENAKDKPSLNFGNNRKIYEHPTGKDKIYTIPRNEDKESHTDYAQIVFYCQNILHELFPDTFPALHAAFNKTIDSAPLQVRQRIYGPTNAEFGIKRKLKLIYYKITGKGNKYKEDFQKAAELFNLTQLHLDEHPKNFVLGKDGFAYVDVDIEELVHMFKNTNPQELFQRISNDFGQEKAQKLRGYIDRLYKFITPYKRP